LNSVDLEGDVIARVQAAVPGPAAWLGDDAAPIPPVPAGYLALVTTDAMIEGIHWDARLSAGDVGWKLVAVNCSDVAAMGGVPAWATLAMSLPRPLDRAWVADFADGLGAAFRHFAVPVLLGGDTTASPAGRALSLTMGGVAERLVRRRGAEPGDLVVVTGVLGRSAEALLSDAPSPVAMAHHRRPRPPTTLGPVLAAIEGVHAMMDISDGLAVDLARLCAASGVGAEVDAAQLPGDGPTAWKTSMGEDFEILAAVSPADLDAVASAAAMHKVAITVVGRFDAERGARLSGGAWPGPLFSHFGMSPTP
jgi:thiamine-monophosphate kinase